jgi:hypothetical protein
MAVAALAGCGGQGNGLHAALPAGFDFAQTGAALMVARPSQPLGYSDGLPAKQAALAYCARQGRALNPAAFGQYRAGAWVFAKGCV